MARGDGPGDLTIRAVPAMHGPVDGVRDADGHVNCEVTGFVLAVLLAVIGLAILVFGAIRVRRGT